MTTKQKQTKICEISNKQCKLVDALIENRISENIFENKHNEAQAEIDRVNNQISIERLDQFKRGEI